MYFKEFYEIGQNTRAWNCDKGTSHSYIEHYYDKEFSNIRPIDVNFLEIGIWEGSSLKLWKSWFINGNIIGIDNNQGIFENKKTTNFTNIIGTTVIWDDAYSDNVVNTFNDNYFDYIIDDGPHTLDSHILCLEKWLPKLKSGGKLIIEDIYYLSESPVPLLGTEITKYIDSTLYTYKFYDLRKIKSRGDDIILEITKN